VLDNASGQQAAIGQMFETSGGNTMTRLSAITTALALAGAATFSQGALAQTGTGWTQLFDGKSLDGWTQVGTANWRVEDGALVADKSTAPARPDGQPGGGGHLVTKNSYKNHMIYAEFWTDEKANSGIFVRCKDPKKIGARLLRVQHLTRLDPSTAPARSSILPGQSRAQVGGKWNHDGGHRQ
jgi:hypothetical protein